MTPSYSSQEACNLHAGYLSTLRVLLSAVATLREKKFHAGDAKAQRRRRKGYHLISGFYFGKADRKTLEEAL